MLDAFIVRSSDRPLFGWHFCRTFASLNCLLLATLIAGNANAAAIDVCTPGELAAAVDKAAPGDRVVMCSKIWKDVVIDFHARGTEGAPVTLAAEAPGKVVLTGSSRIKLSGRYAVIDGLRFEGRYTGPETGVIELKGSGGQCFDCRITNISMIGYTPANESANTKWVVLHGARNRVDHSHFKGKDNMGAMIQVRRDSDNLEPNYDLIDHNFFEERPEFGGEGNTNGDTIEIGSMGKYSAAESRTTFEFNYMRNIDSNFEVITVKSSNNTVRYNVIESSRGVISLRQGHGNLIHGNFILGRGKPRTGGIRVSGRDHVISSNYISDTNPTDIYAYAAVSLHGGTDQVLDISGAGATPYYKYERADNVKVIHNTIVDVGSALVFGGGDEKPLEPRNIDVANNIVLRGEGLAVVDRGMGSNISFDHNLVFGVQAGLNLLGLELLDPLLAPDKNGIQRPTANSPVIDAILDTGDLFESKATQSVAMMDMDGQERTGFADIGADEVVAGEPNRGPIPICGIGPVSYRIDLPVTCSQGIDNVADAPPNPPRSLVVDQ